MEYFKESKVKMTTNEGLVFSGKWSILDDGRVKLDFPVFDKTVTQTFKITFNGNNEMNTIDENNKSEGFKRVQ